MGVTTSSTVANTYEPIATQTLGSNTGSVDFTSIPSTYTDLVLIISGAVTIDSGIQLRFNSDSGSNYSITELYGDGSSAGSNRNSNQTVIGLTETVNFNLSTGQINIVASIFNYANSTTYKSLISRYNDPSSGGRKQVGINAGLWRSTSAITSITLKANTFNPSNQIASGTMITIYGVKGA